MWRPFALLAALVLLPALAALGIPAWGISTAGVLLVFVIALWSPFAYRPLVVIDDSERRRWLRHIEREKQARQFLNTTHQTKTVRLDGPHILPFERPGA